MPSVKAKGILRHHFWGEYSATIFLQFNSSADAQAGILRLEPGWVVSEKQPHILTWTGDSKALDKVTQNLVHHGAEESKIAGLAKSVDYGEPFQIEIEVVPKEQESLF